MSTFYFLKYCEWQGSLVQDLLRKVHRHRWLSGALGCGLNIFLKHVRVARRVRRVLGGQPAECPVRSSACDSSCVEWMFWCSKVGELTDLRCVRLRLASICKGATKVLSRHLFSLRNLCEFSVYLNPGGNTAGEMLCLRMLLTFSQWGFLGVEFRSMILRKRRQLEVP